ncbi:tetratricopeptide repeat protein, partial [Cognatilysobacter segetis]|uniref:tetratricopeptide repeat protein n=1 Tax=Cognatilysobacter segetis TaxID=2492394 RepID=UPI001060AA6E
PHGVAQALNDIGFAHYQLGAYDDAQTYWQRAADAYRRLGDETGDIRTRENLGLLQAARGRWSEATRSQQAALAQARKLQMAEEAAVAYRNLAEVALTRGDVTTAVDNAARARQLFDERDDLRGSVDARLIGIEAALDAGDAASAQRELDALRADLAQASTEQRAIAGRLAARTAQSRGDTRGALVALRAALPQAQASGVRALQLELDLLQARLAGRDVATLDAPTASLGNAALRLDWIDVAMARALAARDGTTVLRLYLEAAPWLRDNASRVAASIHAQAAQAHRLDGDEPGAREAEAAAREASTRFAARLPSASRGRPASDPTP